MLPLPENDYSRPQILASWLELNALAQDDGVAFRGDALEFMRDSQLFPDSSDGSQKEADSSDPNSAAGKLAEAWNVLRSRERLLGTSWPHQLSEDALRRQSNRKQLQDVAAYAAMLLIEAAAMKWYSKVTITPGDQIRKWFEEIVVVCMSHYFKGLTVRFGAPFPAGWPSSFVDRVSHLAGLFGIEARKEEIAKLSSLAQQDDTLDVLARLKVNDELGGVPYLLVQCATGANWKTTKLAEPSMKLWKRYIAWDGPCFKALAIPFELRGKGELETASVRHSDAIVLDRHRLSGALPDELIEVELRKRLTDWCKQMIQAISSNQ